MYTLYRSPAAFYDRLITVVIALIRTTAAQNNFLYYPLLKMTGSYRQSHVTHRSRGHVTNQKRISTFTRLMDPKLSKVMS